MELIVKAKDIFLEYAGRDILDIEELEIYSYDRIGLVGDNGAGKTSLLKILSGNLTIADADVRRFGSIALIGQLDELDLDAAQDSGEMLSRLNVAGVAQETMSGGGGNTRQDCLCTLPACKRDLRRRAYEPPRPRRHPPSRRTTQGI